MDTPSWHCVDRIYLVLPQVIGLVLPGFQILEVSKMDR